MDRASSKRLPCGRGFALHLLTLESRPEVGDVALRILADAACSTSAYRLDTLVAAPAIGLSHRYTIDLSLQWVFGGKPMIFKR